MGFWAHGTRISFRGTHIGKCTSIGLPAQSKTEVRTTSHDSEGWEEFVAGLRDGGTVALTARIAPEDTGQNLLWDSFNQDGQDAEGEVVLELPAFGAPPSRLTFTFDAFVLDTGGDAPFDDAGETTFTLRITGAVERENIEVES